MEMLEKERKTNEMREEKKRAENEPRMMMKLHQQRQRTTNSR